jgi:hypothetical protein
VSVPRCENTQMRSVAGEGAGPVSVRHDLANRTQRLVVDAPTDSVKTKFTTRISGLRVSYLIGAPITHPFLESASN